MVLLKVTLGLRGLGVSLETIQAMSSALSMVLWGCDSISAEIMGLRELKQLVVSGCIVEGDSEVIIRWGLGHNPGSWRHSSSLYEIKELVAAMSISLHHVPRCQNSLVESLANRRVNSPSMICENFIPEDY